MKKEVWIRIVSRNDAEEGETEIISRGSIYKKDGVYHLLYDGMDDEPGAEAVHYRLKLSPKRAEVIRRGNGRSQMIFEPGKSHPCEYHTPYGMMMLSVKTDKLCFTEEEKQISVKLEYRIFMEEIPISTNILEISADGD